MPLLQHLATLNVYSQPEECNFTESAKSFIIWLKACYGDNLTNSTFVLTSTALYAHEVSDTIELNNNEQVINITTTEFCCELEELAQKIDLLVIPREVFTTLPPDDYLLLVNSLKNIDWIIPPLKEPADGIIPHFVVVEELIPKSFAELDWGVELARFAEGRLTVLHAANRSADSSLLTDAEEREYHRRLFDKIAQTDYRTLERGTQLRVFPTNILAALNSIQSEYPPWMTIVPQSLTTYQELQSLDAPSGIFFLKQT